MPLTHAYSPGQVHLVQLQIGAELGQGRNYDLLWTRTEQNRAYGRNQIVLFYNGNISYIESEIKALPSYSLNTYNARNLAYYQSGLVEFARRRDAELAVYDKETNRLLQMYHESAMARYNEAERLANILGYSVISK